MPADAETSERLVCAVLAAQVAAIRDHVDADGTVDLLWRIADALARLSGLVVELAGRHPAADPGLDEQCAAAVAAETEVSRSLDALAFLHAQRHDLARQKADCVVTALERLATIDAPPGGRLSPHDLAAMYISDEQHDVHDAVTRQFGVPVSSTSPVLSTGIQDRESIGK
jgi:hypothetical protein